MIFSKRASYPSLIGWSRTIKHTLGAGVGIERAFRILATKGPNELRAVASHIADDIHAGDSLEDGMAKYSEYFPPLFRDMATVGERSGQLPEMFGELEKYYTLQLSLWREFLTQIIWPVMSFVIGSLVIAGLMIILSWINQGDESKAIDPIGFGLRGVSGALIFLFSEVGFFVGLYLLYRLFTRVLNKGAAVQAMILGLPAIGPCVHTIAMCRFCMTFRITLDSSMSYDEVVRLSLASTGSEAFRSYDTKIISMLKNGREYREALAVCPFFPYEFLEIVAVGEVSGQLPEIMIRQTEHYREESSRKMKLLTKASSIGVYLFVCMLLIIAIFKIASIYLNALGGIGG